MYTGASYPGTNRLYEFTIGAHTADNALQCLSNPPVKYMAFSDNPVSDVGSSNMLFPFLSNKDWLICIPLPFSLKNGFGMNVTLYPILSTIALIACLNVITASAVFRASPNLKSISCWPGATSW